MTKSGTRFHVQPNAGENQPDGKEVYEARLLQNEAQMNAFYSQIRPHFLFNTLNMISMMIQTSKYDMAVANIDRLSDLLRQMAHLNQEITLKQELSLLEDYLSIQSNRYRNRLYYTIDVDPSLHAYRIPALISNPLWKIRSSMAAKRKRTPPISSSHPSSKKSSSYFGFRMMPEEFGSEAAGNPE